MGSISNEINMSILPNKLEIICSHFDLLCSNNTIQSNMRTLQSNLSTYYIKSEPINYDINEYNRLIKNPCIDMGRHIRGLLNETTNLLSTEKIGSGISGTLIKNRNNSTKVIKIVKVRDAILNFDLFNEYIIQKLLYHKMVEINNRINLPLHMNIPNVYSLKKKGGINTFIKMNYISNYVSLYDYITRYTGDVTKLFENIHNLIRNYIIYLRILQNEYSFIHYDMNLHNLLLNIDSENNITEFHLIDFGQSYINLHDYHFLGSTTHASVTSLHANHITNKRNGFWKSVDMIFLLLMIIYRIVEKYNYKKIENRNNKIDIYRIESENPLFYHFIISHFVDINMFEKMFNIIYIEPNYFKFLELNFNHGIDILLRTYPQEDRQEKINYILHLFGKYSNE